MLRPRRLYSWNWALSGIVLRLRGLGQSGSARRLQMRDIRFASSALARSRIHYGLYAISEGNTGVLVSLPAVTCMRAC